MKRIVVLLLIVLITYSHIELILTTNPNVPRAEAATEDVRPDGTASEAAGSCTTANAHTTLDDDPDSPGGDYCTADADTSDHDIRLTFATPTGDPVTTTDAQTFKVYADKSTNGGGNPTVALDLYCNGSLVEAGAHQEITAAGIISETFTFNDVSCASNGFDVEVLLDCTTGGSGGGTRSCNFDAVEWVADYTEATLSPITLTGTYLYNASTTAIAQAGHTITAAVATSTTSFFSTTTDSSGTYSITIPDNTYLSSTTPITLFVDSNATTSTSSATTLTYAIASTTGFGTMNNLNLYQDTLYVHNLTGGEAIDLSNSTNFYDYTDDGDTNDVLIDLDATTATVTADLRISSTTTLIAPSTLLLDGDFQNDGTFDANGGEVVVDGTLNDFADAREVYYSGVTAGKTTRALKIGDDGNKLFYMNLGGANNLVDRYDLSIPYDLSTASYHSATNTWDITGGVDTGLAFSASGDKFYQAGNGTVWEFDMSTPWDVTTAALTNSSSTPQSYDSIPGMSMSPDGTHLYIEDTGGNPDSIHQYTLNTPWDITTLEHVVEHQMPANFPDTIGDFTFTADGRTIILNKTEDDYVVWGELTTPWDITSAVYTDKMYVGYSSVVHGVALHPDGTNLYLGGSGLTRVDYQLDQPQTATGTMTGTSAFNALTLSGSLPVTFGIDASSTATTTVTNTATTTFAAGGMYTFNDIDFRGASSTNEVLLRSSTDDTAWSLIVDGNQANVEYVNVRDSDASLGNEIVAASSTDSGNNTNWAFGGVVGTSTLANHDSGQLENVFSFKNKADKPVLAFNLEVGLENATVTELVLQHTGIQQLETANLIDWRLYIDENNDQLLDGGDTQVGGAGTFAITGSNGSTTFSSEFVLATGIPKNFIVTLDTSDIEKGDEITMNLNAADVSMTGITSDSAVTVTGTMTAVTHFRSAGAGRGGQPDVSQETGQIGDDPSVGDPDESGGGQGGGEAIDTNTGGDTIGNEAGFKWPSAESGSWTTASNAYDEVDGTYATTTSNTTASYTNHDFSVPGTNIIEGIAVKLELSGTTAAGDVDVQLSWDGGTSWTSAKTTPTLNTTDTVVTVGASNDNWGRTWATSELSNANFVVRLTGNPSSNEVRLDAIQVKVFHAAGGGGSGGGGAI